MSSSFLRNFKNLVQKHYACELSDSNKMKQMIFKFKKEHSLPDVGVLARFPKKELKNFIKIECPIDTQDSNLKEQEVQSSLKRLRTLHGVKESLSCQHCSKSKNCKVVNQQAELTEQTAKSGLPDLLTSLYYFAVEVEKKSTSNQQVNSEGEKVEENQIESNKNDKKEKEKADISLEKYRKCQIESSFFKNCSSANKLTDTLHIVLDDLYNNLGQETKKFNNEYIEEEFRRKFMERIFKKVENEIEVDDASRKNERRKDQNTEDDDEEVEIKYNSSSLKKSQKQHKKKQVESSEILDDEDQDFIAVEGQKPKKYQNSQGILNKIMDTDKEESQNYKRAIKEERQTSSSVQKEYKNNKYGKNQENKEEGKYFKRSNERSEHSNGNSDYKANKYEKKEFQRNKGDSSQGRDSYKDRNKSNEFQRSRGESEGRENYKEKRQGNEYKGNRGENQGKENYKERSNSRNEKYHNKEGKYETKERKYDDNKESRFKGREEKNSKYQREEKFSKFGDQIQKEIKLNKDKTDFAGVSQVDENKISKFMFANSGEQKQRIQEEQEIKHSQKEERKAHHFVKDIEKVQEIVQSKEDVLEREVDKKRQPKFSKGPFKFSKTVKSSEE